MSEKIHQDSLILDILNETVSDQTHGLDYAAYVILSDDSKKEKQKSAPNLAIIEARNDQVNDLLSRFGCRVRSAQEQFDLWRDLLLQLNMAIKSLDAIFARTGQGENVRIVFDIDMGGFYYTRLSSNAFLFGATLDQEEVNNGRCEREMYRMVAQIEAIFTVHGA